MTSADELYGRAMGDVSMLVGRSDLTASAAIRALIDANWLPPDLATAHARSEALREFADDLAAELADFAGRATKANGELSTGADDWFDGYAVGSNNGVSKGGLHAVRQARKAAARYESDEDYQARTVSRARFEDLQAEHVRRTESWERQQRRLQAEIDELRAALNSDSRRNA